MESVILSSGLSEQHGGTGMLCVRGAASKKKPARTHTRCRLLPLAVNTMRSNLPVRLVLATPFVYFCFAVLVAGSCTPGF